MDFIIQYTLTILTIVLIPLLLWIGKDKNISKSTYLVFALLMVADIVMFVISDYFPTYLYLAIITILSTFFVKRK